MLSITYSCCHHRYFGHGTGREFLQGDDIQRLDCGAVTLLMGCSSGKLMVSEQMVNLAVLIFCAFSKLA